MKPRVLLALLLPLSLTHCSRTEPELAGARRPVAVSTSSTTGSPQGDRAPAHVTPGAAGKQLSNRLTRPARERIVAIGDLHGDLAATRRAFKLAGAIDDTDHWIGGKLMVVQTGDVVDRGDEDRAVLELLQLLQAEAARAGGELLLLNGNHELMNAALDFRYVTTASSAQFEPQGGRAAAFAPGGPYAKRFAEQPIVARVGDSVFVHGGVLTKHVNYGLDRMNDEVRAWLRAELPSPPDIMLSADGLLWTRLYSLAPTAQDCAQLRSVLASLGATRMIVGHTVQSSGVNAACDGRIWRIDVGLSAFYGGPTEVLEIAGDKLTVLRAHQ